MSRGGTIENIYITRVKADSVRNVLAADLNWNPQYSYSTLPEEYSHQEIPEHWKTLLTPVVPEEKGYPKFRNVYLSHIKADQCKGIYLRFRMERYITLGELLPICH